MNKILLGMIAIIIATSSASGSDSPLVKNLTTPSPNRVLFVGNSYLYYNDSLHNHVRRMVEEKFPEKMETLKYKSATIGGSILSHHNLDHLLNSQNIGIEKKFELVILQGGSSEPLAGGSRIRFFSRVKEMVQEIRLRDGEAALYMTHAFVEPHEDYDPEMTSLIRNTYVRAGNENDVLVIPVGLAFQNAYRTKPGIKLHKTFDGTHPDLLGTYLAASVVFASIYKSSPVGLSYNYFGAISDDDRDFLQRVANDTVKDFFN